MWQFKVLPFSLSLAPFTFTKTMKPVMSALRRLEIRLILYLNDMLVLNQSKEKLLCHLASVLKLLISLGFLVNLNKSMLTPTRKLEFLGFLIDSTQMVISLPRHKMHSITQLARSLVTKGREGRVSLRQLARIVGTMVAAHLAVLPTPLYYRFLESAKSSALRQGLLYQA